MDALQAVNTEWEPFVLQSDGALDQIEEGHPHAPNEEAQVGKDAAYGVWNCEDLPVGQLTGQLTREGEGIRSEGQEGGPIEKLTHQATAPSGSIRGPDQKEVSGVRRSGAPGILAGTATREESPSKMNEPDPTGFPFLSPYIFRRMPLAAQDHPTQAGFPVKEPKIQLSTRIQTKTIVSLFDDLQEPQVSMKIQTYVNGHEECAVNADAALTEAQQQVTSLQEQLHALSGKARGEQKLALQQLEEAKTECAALQEQLAAEQALAAERVEKHESAIAMAVEEAKGEAADAQEQQAKEHKEFMAQLRSKHEQQVRQLEAGLKKQQSELQVKDLKPTQARGTAHTPVHLSACPPAPTRACTQARRA